MTAILVWFERPSQMSSSGEMVPLRELCLYPPYGVSEERLDEGRKTQSLVSTHERHLDRRARDVQDVACKRSIPSSRRPLHLSSLRDVDREWSEKMEATATPAPCDGSPSREVFEVDHSHEDRTSCRPAYHGRRGIVTSAEAAVAIETHPRRE